ncbi:MAG: serine hydrolase domain-containing protein [Pseudomonadota bacterium]
MKTICFWVFGILLAVMAAAQTSLPKSSIADFVEREMAEAAVPGLSYSLVEDGQVRTGQAGVKQLGSSEPVAPETGFVIGSVSKGLTALGVVQLSEAGVIDLDASISDYLGVFYGNPTGAAVTVRQLLSHTSGYSTYQGNLTQDDFATDERALERRAKAIGAMPPAHTPGTVWDYSNANYALAGRLIEVMSGQSYSDYMNTRVFQPAGMVNTFTYTRFDDPRISAAHEPWLISRRIIAQQKFGQGSVPQGGIVSTAGDLALYLALMMNGEDDLISAQSKAMMMTPASKASPEYGLGWFIEREDGYTLVTHEGVSPGHEALVAMLPVDKKGAAILVNSGSGTGFGETGHLRRGFVARALGLDYDESGSGWGRKGVYLFFMIAPILFLIAMVWAVVKRDTIRAKTGLMRHVSLWLPVVTTGALAIVAFVIIPNAAGAPLNAVRVFQPDFGLGLITTGLTGIVWAVLRLILAYSGQSGKTAAE